MPFGLTPKAKAEARGEAKRKSMKPEASCIHALVHVAIICTLAADEVSRPEVFGPPPPPSRQKSLARMLGLPTRHEVRFVAPSQGGYFLEKRGIHAGFEVSQHMRAKVAARASHPRFTEDVEGTLFEHIESTGRVLGKGMAASRRAVIAYVFSDIYGCPPPEEWRG